MNLLRVVAHTDWGADSASLLKLYRTHIRSKLDYGCIVYGSTRQSYLQSLDTVQNVALRICLGSYRTSPIASLHVEANELPTGLEAEFQPYATHATHIPQLTQVVLCQRKRRKKRTQRKRLRDLR